MEKTYSVSSLTLGETQQRNEIVFKTVEDLKKAMNDINNGNDLYVKVDGKVTVLPYKMLNTRVYEGQIAISALEGEEE